jgi:cytochrome P450
LNGSLTAAARAGRAPAVAPGGPGDEPATGEATSERSAMSERSPTPSAVAPDHLGPLPEFLRHGGSGAVVRVRTPTGDRLWVVGDYALGRLVLTDPRFSRAAAAKPHAPTFTTANPAPTSVMSMDGADHARLRRLVAGAFTPRRVAALTPLVEQLAGELLDRIEVAGPPVDLVASFAAPLPFAVVCLMLGIPPEDREQFHDWVGVLFDVTASTPQEKARRSFALFTYMSGLVDRKRAEPADDVLCALIRAHDAGALSRTELVDLGLALLTAGYETTVGQISLSVLSLLLEPALRDDLVAGGVSAAAVEELLRITPATPLSFPRVAVQDVELAGVRIAAGDGVVVSLLHGNRDRAVFPAPERFDPAARSAAHLTFGHGTHYCLGAPLARLQVRLALDALLRRLPKLALADADAVGWKDGLAMRGLSRLSVTW